ncbi:MAG: hydrogenase maturation nickel metallochaperone HypA [Gemmataceae bacterium]
MTAIEMATAFAREQGATTIHRIVLRVGAYSGVDPEALAFAFDAASADTPARHAKLEIEPIPARCWCLRCRTEFAPPGPSFVCPKCGAVDPEMSQGGELELATLEVS